MLIELATSGFQSSFRDMDDQEVNLRTLYSRDIELAVSQKGINTYIAGTIVNLGTYSSRMVCMWHCHKGTCHPMKPCTSNVDLQ